MNDLLRRARKYSKSAGRTGEGQRQAAVANERASGLLGWLSVALSTAVGTSLFTDWVSQYPVVLGLTSLLAAVLGALHQRSKLAERAEQHRKCAAKYGAIRREADMLSLRVEGEDLSRPDALTRLDDIGQQLSELAEGAPALADRIYDRAKRKFDNEHEEEYEGAAAS